jgi:hypothetical protein
MFQGKLSGELNKFAHRIYCQINYFFSFPQGVFVTILLVVFKQAFAQICVVDTYAGTGLDGFSGDGGDAKSATLNNFFGGVWVNTANTVFIADNRNKRIRTVNQGTKIITTIAGYYFFF